VVIPSSHFHGVIVVMTGLYKFQARENTRDESGDLEWVEDGREASLNSGQTGLQDVCTAGVWQGYDGGIKGYFEFF
jgi:hypothetical protein